VCGLIRVPELIGISALACYAAVNPHLNLPQRQSLVERDFAIVIQIAALDAPSGTAAAYMRMDG